RFACGNDACRLRRLIETCETALELANAFAERATDLRNALGAKQQQEHHEQHQQLVEPNFSKHRRTPEWYVVVDVNERRTAVRALRNTADRGDLFPRGRGNRSAHA